MKEHKITYQQKVLKRLCSNVERTAVDIQDGTDLTMKQVSIAISSLLDKGMIQVVGQKRYGSRQYVNIYKKANIADQYVLSAYRHRLPFKAAVKHKEYPFSYNEMHYGRSGHKWSWRDVRSEAIEIGYKENSTKNKLPFNYVNE